MGIQGSIFIMVEDNRTCLGFQPKQVPIEGLILEQIRYLYKKYNNRIISNIITIVYGTSKNYYKVLKVKKSNYLLVKTREQLFDVGIKNDMFDTYIKAPSRLYAEWFYFARNKDKFSKKTKIYAKGVK